MVTSLGSQDIGSQSDISLFLRRLSTNADIDNIVNQIEGGPLQDGKSVHKLKILWGKFKEAYLSEDAFKEVPTFHFHI